MTDYFALFELPRAPWLDPCKLKEIYHRKTLGAHPDTQAGGGNFAGLNEGYRVLREPKSRLHHLLALAGQAPPSSGVAVPKALADLFPAVSLLTQEVQELRAKKAAATNALSQSLLQAQAVKLEGETATILGNMRALHEQLLKELQMLNESWQKSEAGAFSEATALYFQFAFLTRWLAQVEEIQFQLDT